MVEKLASYKFSFLMIIFCNIEGDFFSGPECAPEVFFIPRWVILDKSISCIQNRRRTSIVLIECDDHSSWEIFLIVQDIIDVSSPPRVNRLVGISNSEDIVVPTGQKLNQKMLRPVRVLVLINEDKVPPILVRFEHIWMGLKQLDRKVEQIIKVDRFCCFEFSLVHLIQGPDRRIFFRKLLRRDKPVFSC